MARWRAGDLDPDLSWQPELWCALVAVVGADPPHLRHEKTLTALRARPAGLPPRLSLFGHTRMAVTDIELLGALATHHELHLWLPHPSAALWRSLADLHGVVPRRADASHRRVVHPLLATLGRDLRELQRGLPADPATDEALGATTRPDTLLGWLQSDLAANQVGRKTERWSPATGPSRCTAATGPPVRSTCCVRSCSACSPMTRRWNLATSW
ncbi:exodeoxyribonuclease V, gamma subunit [Mycobacterium ulcerans str. Harvey]|uniref:Exodeoxyribonuclease V, gamma subunit n=1 Tax=Mycobacterium ulcerans str. Harvey TaxID=1299332 RepID=A0ABN0R5S5_MYCUL|nr:exodeoxyribonuclease V, gamma subunit [Mycobacterium ulcerans str. Harvey]